MRIKTLKRSEETVVFITPSNEIPGLVYFKVLPLTVAILHASLFVQMVFEKIRQENAEIKKLKNISIQCNWDFLVRFRLYLNIS